MIHISVKHMFRCLYQLELILQNPARDIRYKPGGVEQKRGVLSKQEMNTFLDSIAINEPGGLQERCVFELMYATAIRCGEVGRLTIGDIDFNRRMLWVREAKWGKDRLVPICETAVLFLKQHLEDRLDRKEERVFRCKVGRLSQVWINVHFKKRLKDLDMYRKGMSAHSIRHSAAVNLLANGADIRYVQELLGHESLETTAGYTNELYENLKRIYKSFHPRENTQYLEVDAEYRQELEKFYRRVKNWKECNAKKRETKKRWNEKRKREKNRFDNKKKL
jgi:site-specific recombinase XerD